MALEGSNRYVPRPKLRRHKPVVIIDPFAGGVVRGFVAAAKGCLYLGVDCSAEQVRSSLVILACGAL